MARAAGVNLLRVWGGGLREKRAFYDACDRAGILVWQEFPFACVFFGRLPRSVRYLALVRQESEAIVRALRHHPSVMTVWCGGNEFSPTRNRAVVQALRESVATLDGDASLRACLSRAGGSAQLGRVARVRAGRRLSPRRRGVRQ